MSKAIAVEQVENVVEEQEVLTNEELATKLTRRYVLWSMGGSIIPIAFLDLAAVIAAQVKMVNDMAKIYDTPFSEARTKSIVSALISSLGLAPAGAAIFGSVMKLIPGVGTLIGTLSLPIVVGALTYATGKVFIMHFEAGGTLLDFDAEKMKAYFGEQFAEGKEVAKKMDVSTPRATAVKTTTK